MSIVSLGIEVLDVEHREIVDLNLALFNAINGRGPAVDSFDVMVRLYRLAKTHFKSEEDLFVGWDGAAYHTNLHNDMVRQLNRIFIKFDVQSADYDKSRQMEHLTELSNFVSSWFNNHIAYEDTKYIPFLRGKLAVSA